MNRQYAQDQYSVWTFEPSADVVAISDNSGFTEKGKFIFYATKPSVEDQAGFNEECPRQEAGSPILGCYTTDDRIYIYDLTNEKLKGMEEVTAVHEMLHAVWTRSSQADKQKLDTELRAAYNSLNDEDLKTRMSYYERTEPGEFINELHSILGTEEPNLGPWLEAYYEKYFDRATVLKLHQQYSTVYKELHGRADTLYASMESLAATIEARSTAYDAEAAQLSADIASFNERANSGSFSSQSQFNAERAALVRRTSALDAERDAINAYIVTYNGYYAEYQTIAKQIEVLNDSIDSFKQIDQGPSV